MGQSPRGESTFVSQTIPGLPRGALIRQGLVCSHGEKEKKEALNSESLFLYILDFPQMYEDRSIYRIGVLTEMHRITIDGVYECAGHYRESQTDDVMVNGANFDPTPGHRVRLHLEDWLEQASSWKSHTGPIDWSAPPDNVDDLLEHVVRSAHSFTVIHPFRGGNGRVVRAFAQMMLWEIGFLDRPSTILPFLGVRRIDYLNSLASADRGDIQYWKDLMMMGILSARIDAMVKAVRKHRSLYSEIRSHLSKDTLKYLSRRNRERLSFEDFYLQTGRALDNWQQASEKFGQNRRF